MPNSLITSAYWNWVLLALSVQLHIDSAVAKTEAMPPVPALLTVDDVLSGPEQKECGACNGPYRQI